MTMAAAPSSTRLSRLFDRESLVHLGGLLALGAFLVVTILLPLYTLLSKSFKNRDGDFVGLANYRAFLSDPTLSQSIVNSVLISVAAAAITVSLAFLYAYGLSRTRIPFKSLFRGAALIPLLAPSLLPGIALVYLFGNQGIAKSWLFGHSIYGPIGIVLGEVFFTFPHALIILITAMSMADQRLYEAADVLRAGRVRTFLAVTLPSVKYGLISSFFVAFTLVITDFGVPKVIGGQFNVLATDVYKQVIGQQNFEMGAVVGLILLIPAALAFAVDRVIQRRQTAMITARSVAFRSKTSVPRDVFYFLFCTLMAACLLAIVGTAGYASLVKFWPYDLTITLKNYDFTQADGGGADAYLNSIKMALWTAVIGTAVIFTGAYLTEKRADFPQLRGAIQLLTFIPLAVPGLVLGLSYIFFFNDPANPLGWLYQTMPILVICTVVHFYTVSHLTAVTALKQLDSEFEAVAASLRAPFYVMFFRVTVPICLPAILDISIYLFANAMTTVSAVVFLYSPDTMLASVAVLNMDDAGDVAPAAAMGMMIVLTTLAVRVIHAFASRGLLRRTQVWRA